MKWLLGVILVLISFVVGTQIHTREQPVVYFINIPAVTPEGLAIKWVDIDLAKRFSTSSLATIELIAVEGWLEPAYLNGYDAGHTKFFVRLKTPTVAPILNYDAHTNNDPYIVAQMSLATFASNTYRQIADQQPTYLPAIPNPLPIVPPEVQITLPIQLLSRNGVGVAREDTRWEPPGQLFIIEPISIGIATTNPGALLHIRVWVKVY